LSLEDNFKAPVMNNGIENLAKQVGYTDFRQKDFTVNLKFTIIVNPR